MVLENCIEAKDLHPRVYKEKWKFVTISIEFLTMPLSQNNPVSRLFEGYLLSLSSNKYLDIFQ